MTQRKCHVTAFAMIPQLTRPFPTLNSFVDAQLAAQLLPEIQRQDSDAV